MMRKLTASLLVAGLSARHLSSELVQQMVPRNSEEMAAERRAEDVATGYAFDIFEKQNAVEEK